VLRPLDVALVARFFLGGTEKVVLTYLDEGRPIDVPAIARETAVLEILLRRSGNVAPKRLFEDHLFGLSGDVGSNAVEVYVHRLRKILADAGATVKIHTVRGVGYLMAVEKAE